MLRGKLAGQQTLRYKAAIIFAGTGSVWQINRCSALSHFLNQEDPAERAECSRIPKPPPGLDGS